MESFGSNLGCLGLYCTCEVPHKPWTELGVISLIDKIHCQVLVFLSIIMCEGGTFKRVNRKIDGKSFSIVLQTFILDLQV